VAVLNAGGEAGEDAGGNGGEVAVTTLGNAAAAFLCYKALMPVRLSVTVALTPVVARLLRFR